MRSFQGHFFPTDRGRRAIEHAIEIARAHLAISARSIEISLTGPLEHFVSLTCNHSVQVHDHRLPGGAVWGKVKALKLYLDGEGGKQWGELTLGVSLGSDQNEFVNPIRESPESLYSLEYAESDYSVDHLQGMTPSALSYHLESQQNDHDKWIYPDAITNRDIVEKVVIKNRAKDQNAHLLRRQYPAHHAIEDTLKKIPTQIHIQLAELKTWKTQVRNFSAKISRPWSAPQQINL